MPTDVNFWENGQLVEILKEKASDIELMQKKLDNNLQQIRQLIVEIENKPDDISCADNAERVMSELFQKANSSMMS